jgi:hypothetical protein
VEILLFLEYFNDEEQFLKHVYSYLNSKIQARLRKKSGKQSHSQ